MTTQTEGGNNSPATRPEEGRMTTKAKAKDDQRSESQAKAQFDSIKEMVERLRHCEQCEGGEDCTLDDATIKGGIGLYHKAGHPTHGQPATEHDREQYHDRQSAQQVISEDALSVEVRSDWHTPGNPDSREGGEYMILLCTGGPACRIVGSLDEYRQPETARIEHQDWFTPWTEYRLDCDEESIVLDYARQFYFGE